ncbi:uncharacterized protein LOC135345381 isoform X4 [Halichondria panicea]|uniref:uncharacterized protein LOC135345381 isoform X4 n=1 Tax=Halichondria panicea TaxID=6063 RepID=UPI00312B701E
MTTNIGNVVLVSCNEQLVTHFASDPRGYAGVLFQNHLISEETNQEIQLDKTNTAKARMLVLELQAKVKSFPGTYDKFITILRERNERHDDDLISALTDKYKELEAVDQTNSAETEVPVEPQRIVATMDYEDQAGGELTPRSVSTSSSGIESLTASDSNTDRTFFNFQCGCGKCTILGHVTGRDKCLSSKPPQIKRFTRDTPCSENRVSSTEISYSTFKTALHNETQNIHSKFCSLLTNTITNLEKQYDITKVKQYVQALLTPQGSYFNKIYRKPSEEILIRDVTSFSELSDYLQNNFCSWFNYSLISAIREEFLFSNKNDPSLVRYEHFFQQYINRRCFLFVDDFGPQPSHIESVEITCKIDVDFDAITFDQIQKLKLVFVNCWGQLLPHQVLNLKHVQEGCTELVFRVPAYFRHVYSQLSPEQMQHLKENAFIEVKIGQQVILKAEVNSTKKLLKAFGQDGGDLTSALALLIGLDPTVDVSSIRDSDGMTLLHLACRWDWSKWGLLVTQLVKTHHHNVSVVNEDGDTPLHTAARFNNKGAAEYLLELSDVNARNNDGLTAFNIAHQKQHQNVLRGLVECDEILANIPMGNFNKIEDIHRTSINTLTDALPMPLSADESTSTEEDSCNSTTGVSTVERTSPAVSVSLPHQSRAERYGRTIRSRNLQSDDSEPDQQYTLIDQTKDSKASECIKNPTIPEKNPPTYNPPRSPAKTSLQWQSIPRGSIPDLHTQPNDSDLEGLINSKRKHQWDTMKAMASYFCHVCFKICQCHTLNIIERKAASICLCFVMGVLFTMVIFACALSFTILNDQESKPFGGSVHITQLIQQSVLPIARVGPNVKQLTINEITNTNISIHFNISNCDDIRKENSTIYEEGILTPEENTPIYELYTQYNVSLRLEIHLSANYNSSECPVVLVVFDNVDEYKSFLHNGTWMFTYMEYCIKNDNFSISISLQKSSYYFIGVHIEDNLNVIDSISYRINGWNKENSKNSFISLCSMISSTTVCNVVFDRYIPVTPKLCIIGIVPKRNFTNEVTEAEILYSYSNFLYTEELIILLWISFFIIVLLWSLVLVFYKIKTNTKFTTNSLQISPKRHRSFQNSNSFESQI